MTGSRLAGGVAVDAHPPGSRPGIDPLPVPAETVHCELNAHGWRYCALEDVPYERHVCILGGGFGMVLTGLVSAVGNSRRRRQAEALAAPQWRPLGPLRIAIASDRLLVWHCQAWSSVWLAAVIGSRWDPATEALQLFFDREPPYCLAGPEVRSLATWLARPDILPRSGSSSNTRSGQPSLHQAGFGGA